MLRPSSEFQGAASVSAKRVRCSLGKRATSSAVLALPMESAAVPILRKY
jgi:hypothetical protein